MSDQEVREVRTFGMHCVIVAELRADAAVDMDAYLAQRIREQLAHQDPDAVPVTEPTIDWHEVTHAEELMSWYYEEPGRIRRVLIALRLTKPRSGPTVRAGDWRAFVRMRVAVPPS